MLLFVHFRTVWENVWPWVPFMFAFGWNVSLLLTFEGTAFPFDHVVLCVNWLQIEAIYIKLDKNSFDYFIHEKDCADANFLCDTVPWSKIKSMGCIRSWLSVSISVWLTITLRSDNRFVSLCVSVTLSKRQSGCQFNVLPPNWVPSELETCLYFIT